MKIEIHYKRSFFYSGLAYVKKEKGKHSHTLKDTLMTEMAIFARYCLSFINTNIENYLSLRTLPALSSAGIIIILY